MDHVPDGLAVEVWALQVGDLFVAPLEFSQIAGVVSVKEYRVLVGVVAVSESVGELACPLDSDGDFDEAECFHHVGSALLVTEGAGAGGGLCTNSGL